MCMEKKLKFSPRTCRTFDNDIQLLESRRVVQCLSEHLQSAAVSTRALIRSYGGYRGLRGCCATVIPKEKKKSKCDQELAST